MSHSQEDEEHDVLPLTEHYNLRKINDPVHGYIELDPICFKVIDTPQFQRLRNLKQLGSSYYVFPGATHNRFEHSIGTAHLASQVVKLLRERHPERKITARDVRCVTLAGLCHDLGHGPFSHVFDNTLIPRARPDKKWSHEEASEMMLAALFKELAERGERLVADDEIEFIQDLIRGKPREGTTRIEKMFLFQIVANAVSGLDVDKFDYIARDTRNLGINSTHDTTRILQSVRVVGDDICYDHKEVVNIAELFHTRWSLHRRIYTHKASKAIEYMIVDALIAADKHLGISSKIDDPEQYLYLTDSVVEDIQRSILPELSEARALLRRLSRRDLYRCVDYSTYPSEDISKEYRDALTPAFIASCAVDGKPLDENDIIVDWTKIHHGMGKVDPASKVKFWSKQGGGPNQSFLMRPDQWSYSRPECFEEIWLRCFTRDPSKFGAVQHAFRAAREKLGEPNRFAPTASSPCQAPAPNSPDNNERTGPTPHAEQQQRQQRRTLSKAASFNEALTVGTDHVHKSAQSMPMKPPAMAASTSSTPRAHASRSFQRFSSTNDALTVGLEYAHGNASTGSSPVKQRAPALAPAPPASAQAHLASGAAAFGGTGDLGDLFAGGESGGFVEAQGDEPPTEEVGTLVAGKKRSGMAETQAEESEGAHAGGVAGESGEGPRKRGRVE